jgi:hypothetical protein
MEKSKNALKRYEINMIQEEERDYSNAARQLASIPGNHGRVYVRAGGKR